MITNPNYQKYAADFNVMTDEDIEASMREAEDAMQEHEEWLEAVAAWEAAGRPRG